MNDHTPRQFSNAETPGPATAEHDQASRPDSGSAQSSGEDMLKILASVEEQFTRLRAAKKSQDDALSAMAERNRLLHQADQELRQMRQDLRQQQEMLQHDRDRFVADQAQFQDQCRRWESQTASQRQEQTEFESARRRWQDEKQKFESSLSQRETEQRDRQTQIDRRENDFQRERDRISAMESECRQQRETTSRRAAELEKDHKDLLQRVNQAEANVGQLIKDIETSEKKLADKTASVEKAGSDAKALTARVRELEKGLTEATHRAEQVERDAQDAAKTADKERQRENAKLATQIKEAQSARDAAKQEIAATKDQAKTLDSQIRKMQSQIAERDAQLTDQRQKLEMATAKLSEFAGVLAEQTPQLERGAAALVMVEQQHEQIERLTQQLAEMQLRTDPEEGLRREQRITQLTEALRQARGQSVNSLGVADIERRNAELTTEVERLKVDAANANLAAEEVRRQLKESSGKVSSPQVQDAIVAEQAAKIAALSAEIEQVKSKAATEIKAKMEAQIEAQVEARVTARMKELKPKTQGGGKSKSDTAETNALREKIVELQQELADARASAASASSTAPLAPSEVSAQLRQKAERVTAVAEHLRRRRQRLRKLRLLMNSQGTQHHAAGKANFAEVEQERQQIVELRRLLAASEQTMIRRWARPRAISSVVWIAVLAVICAVASWFAADQVSPAKIAASVVIQAKTSNGLPMSDAQANDWRTWHTGLFTDKSFVDTLAKRMAERRIDTYANPDNLTRRMAADLTIDSSQRNSLILTLAGTNDDEVRAVLDVIASTVITESGHQNGNRNDAAWAISPSERTEAGRIRYADINPVPIKDERLTMAMPIFGGMFLAVMAFIGLVYTRLMNAKRVFDQDNAALFVDAKVNVPT